MKPLRMDESARRRSGATDAQSPITRWATRAASGAVALLVGIIVMVAVYRTGASGRLGESVPPAQALSGQRAPACWEGESQIDGKCWFEVSCKGSRVRGGIDLKREGKCYLALEDDHEPMPESPNH